MRTFSWHGAGGSLTDTVDATVKVFAVSTVSGAPSSVTVATPVVDLSQPVRVTVSRHPEIGTLEWRASNALFGASDSTPSWSSPTGAFRYWQARVTWSGSGQLLERIEFLSALPSEQAYLTAWAIHIEFFTSDTPDNDLRREIVLDQSQTDLQGGWQDANPPTTIITYWRGVKRK